MYVIIHAPVRPVPVHKIPSHTAVLGSLFLRRIYYPEPTKNTPLPLLEGSSLHIPPSVGNPSHSFIAIIDSRSPWYQEIGENLIPGIN